MGVVKNTKSKAKKDELKKNIENEKPKKDKKVKKKNKVSCLQCIRSPSDDGGLEGKYRVAAPELMQDTFMSDSEDEGGEVECPIQQQQQYRYMNSEAGTLHRARPLEDSVTDGHLYPSNNDKKVATIDRQPLDIGFLVSFVVDARGGAMKAKRRGGVRIVVPPAACAAPTRVTCRAATRRAPVAAPPPLMEGEALASRLLELQPQGAKFLAPVIIEVPIFTSSCKEREIVILRSDTGDTWQDHYLHNNDNPMIQEALHRERLEHGTSGETLGENGERVTRIITCDFPHYLAVVSRVRQEVHIIGPEGGTVSSSHIPQVQALFPPAALTKRIRVGVQAHGAPAALRRRTLPRHVGVAPVLTVEPRRRKFHRSITLTSPLPTTENGSHDKQSTTNLRLLCSIMGGQARAVWEDVTGSTPLTITDDCASFTTTVSARFWLMNCQNVSDATKLATELYKEMLLVPFEVRIVVLGKRLDALEGRLLVLYITDRYAYETLLQQEHYTEVAHSTSVKFLDTKEVYLEFSGNLVPVTKSGSQPMFKFEAFKDNRVEFPVRVKHHEESPSGRIYFMNEPKVPKGEQSQTPACVLDVELPDRIAPRAGKSQVDYLNLDQSGFDALKDELSFHSWDHHHHHEPIAPPPPPPLNGHTDDDLIITNGDVKYPTKDTEDIVTKPQPNGDTNHVDSNKVKATFDSDEDKTPMNTLEKGDKEKGKKKEGFLGGLADKVKHVFSHSQDEDDPKDSPKSKSRDSKEKSPPKQKKDKNSPKREDKEKSPPKQQKEKTPKPEEKEKSPPKSAPTLISEDLLEKVDDMFKDLKTKPHHKEKEEDLTSEVYTTRLVVDEDRPAGLQNITEEVYEQYANMQPVETPMQVPKKDPFAYPTVCCDGPKGPKHSHEETSTLLDQIEQAKFAAHEKLHDVGDKVQSNVDEGVDNLRQEKDKLQRQAAEFKDDLIIKEENLIAAAKDHANDAKHTAEDGINKLAESAEETHDNINSKATDIQSNITNEFDNVKAATNDAYDHIIAAVTDARNSQAHKAHTLDFLAREQAEEHKVRAHDQLSQIGQKAQDGANAVSDTFNVVKDDVNHKAQNLKASAKETAENIKDKTNEKLHDLGESIDNATGKAEEAAADLKAKAGKEKDKAKKEAKKAKKEGKNFISGLVSNIFGEKDKIEKEVKGKVAEAKDAANNVLDEASAKKDEIKEAAEQKHDELKDGANRLVENVNEKAKEADKALHDKKEELQKAAHDKKEDVQHEAQQVADAIHSKTEEVSQAIQDKKEEVSKAVNDKKEEVASAVHDTAEQVGKAINNKKEEVEQGIQNKKEAIQDKAQEVGKAIHNKTQEVSSAVNDKANEVSTAIHDKKDEALHAASELGQVVHDKTQEVSNAAKDKAHEVSSAIHDKKEEVSQAIHDKTHEVGTAIHDKADEAKHTLQNKASELGNTIHDKKDSIENAIYDKKAQVQNVTESEMDRIRQTAEQTTDQIKKSAEDTINAAADKKSELQASLSNKFDDLQTQGHDELQHIQSAASDKLGDLQQGSKDAFEHVQDSALSTFDKVESSAKDKVSDAKDQWEDLQSSTRDTYADFRDDVHGLESSAQDTLHSFQSSAGNTFDSLDDSAKEFLGGVQSSTQSFENNSKELFGDVKESFEGFQVSAENKLEDVKGAAKERLEDVSERLEGEREGAKDAVASEADKFTSSLNDLGNSVFGSSGKGFMKDSSTKLLESEKAQSSPSPHKKGSGIPKLKKKGRK